MAKIEHVSHVKSKLPREIEEGEFYGLTPTADNSDEADSSPVKLNLAKRPTAENIIYGEIAVNYKKGHETITIKNDEDEIVGFVNENDFNNAQEIVASALANEKTEREQQINIVEEKVSTVEQSSGEVKNDLSELDLAVSAALNDLNSRIGQQSGEFEESIQNLQQDLENLENNLEEYHDDTELIISSSLNDLNERINDNSENIENLDNKIDQSIQQLDEKIDNSFDNFDKSFDDFELAISSSLNDLNERINDVDGNIDNKIEQVTEEVERMDTKIDTLTNDTEEHFNEVENVVSSSLNDLNSRISTIENNASNYATQSWVEEQGYLKDEDLHDLEQEVQTLGMELDLNGQSLEDAHEKVAYLLETVGGGDNYEGSYDFPSDLLHRVAELERLINTVSYCYDYFDFGLPSGALWSTRNIGATSATDNGLYFAWGETTGYTAAQVGHDKSFVWADYELGDKDPDRPVLSKYNSTDGKTVCEAVDDAATVNMIGKWHLPTMQQLKEILQNTKNGWISDSGVFTVFSWSNDGEGGLDGNPTNTSVSGITAFNGKAGFLFFKSDVSDIPAAIDKNNYIFVPAAGNCYSGLVHKNNEEGYIWTSTLYANLSDPDPDSDYYNAWVLMFTPSAAYFNHSVLGNATPRFNGNSIRGVIG